MPTMQENYEKISALRAENPELTIADICRTHKINAYGYYAIKKRLAAKAPKSQKPKVPKVPKEPKPQKVKYQRIEAPEPQPSTGKLVMVMGSHEQIREFIGGM